MRTESIPAVVLTCDEYRAFAKHMILAYERVWPDHRFEFRVPYQERPLRIDGSATPRVKAIETPKHIKHTVLELLSDLEDDEWVYWAMDDRYPIAVDQNIVNATIGVLETITDPNVVGLSFSRVRGLYRPSNVFRGEEMKTEAGLRYLRRKRMKTAFWPHQFYRTRYLRYVFASFPDSEFKAKSMDKYITYLDKGDNPVRRGKWRLYVAERNGMVQGESTSRGVVTKNCARSIRAHGLQLPAFKVGDQEVIIGSLGTTGHVRETLHQSLKVKRRRLKSLLKSLKPKFANTRNRES